MMAFASELYAIPGGVVRRSADDAASEITVIPFSKVTSIRFSEPSSPAGTPKYDWCSC